MTPQGVARAAASEGANERRASRNSKDIEESPAHPFFATARPRFTLITRPRPVSTPLRALDPHTSPKSISISRHNARTLSHLLLGALLPPSASYTPRGTSSECASFLTLKSSSCLKSRRLAMNDCNAGGYWPTQYQMPGASHTRLATGRPRHHMAQAGPGLTCARRASP